jgi:hypothetical protein
MADEESGFNVVDKRHVHDASVNEAAASTPTPETSDAPPQPEPERQPHPEALPKLAVRDRLLMCIDILYQSAWISMGMVSDPSSGQIERNMEDAKIAIDSVAFLAGKLEGKLDDSTGREIKRLVSDLQVNFVRQSQQQPS